MAAPVREDQELDLRIESLAYGGNGVARLNGFVVFVRRGLPGDVVRARVTKVKRNHAEALAVDVVEAGAPRVDAPCEHYPECGGCRFQDLAYEAQVAAKAEQVEDALRRIGGVADPPLEPIVPAESVFHYRNKLEYSFTQTPEGPALGFHRAGRWDEVLDIASLLADDRPRQRDPGSGARLGPGASTSRRTTRASTRDTCATSSSARAGTRARCSSSSSRLRAKLDARRASSRRSRRFPEVRSIHWSVNERPAEVTNLPTQLLYGDEAIEEELCGLRFRVRPNAFLQTNTAMAERLYGLAREYAELTGEESVYDLYCGIGTIGLTLARRCADGVGGGRLGGVGRLRARERRSERDLERGVLRGRGRRGCSRTCASAPAIAGRRRRRPAASRPLGQGAAPAWRASSRSGSSTSRATRRRSPAT